MKFTNKRAEMGIGTLIIFIAMLLVAAVAAGVLIQTNSSLQEKALTTGDQAKGQISTNVRVIEVSATNGGDGDIEIMNQIVKLSPGSEPVKLSQVLLTLNTFDSTSTLTYRGTSGIHAFGGPNGFNTLGEKDIELSVDSDFTTATIAYYDLNDDGVNDSIEIVSNDIYYQFNSSLNTTIGQCTGAGAIASLNASGDGAYIESFSQSGSPCAGAGNFSTDGGTSNYLTVTPNSSGSGYFTVEYLQRGSNPVDGNLQRGDVIRLYYIAPRNITEDEQVRINFIPKIGTPTLTDFITPEVISEQRIYLYP